MFENKRAGREPWSGGLGTYDRIRHKWDWRGNAFNASTVPQFVPTFKGTLWEKDSGLDLAGPQNTGKNI